jgi:hypothetical protein
MHYSRVKACNNISFTKRLSACRSQAYLSAVIVADLSAGIVADLSAGTVADSTGVHPVEFTIVTVKRIPLGCFNG